jgi:hypothetical protein
LEQARVGARESDCQQIGHTRRKLGSAENAETKIEDQNRRPKSKTKIVEMEKGKEEEQLQSVSRGRVEWVALAFYLNHLWRVWFSWDVFCWEGATPLQPFYLDVVIVARVLLPNPTDLTNHPVAEGKKKYTEDAQFDWT